MVVLDIRDIRLQFAVWAFSDSMQHISSLKLTVSRLLLTVIITIFIIPFTGLHTVPGESSRCPSVLSFV